MYDKSWIDEVSVNECTVREYAAEFVQNQSKAWMVLEPLLLLKAITVIDLTTLAGDDTASNVTRLVNKATRPLRSNTLVKLQTSIVNLIRELNSIGLTYFTSGRFETVVECNGHRLNYEDFVELISLLKRLGFDGDDVPTKLSEFLAQKTATISGTKSGAPLCCTRGVFIEENDSGLLLPLYRSQDSKNESYANVHVGAICVYPRMVEIVANAQREKQSYRNARNMAHEYEEDIYWVPIAAVSAGFPAGQYDLQSKIMETSFAIQSGATEIDIVISRCLVLGECWEELYTEIEILKQVCGQATMKTILAVGECGSLENVYKASMVAMMAGSDYIKTSTGKEVVNATIPVGIVMCRAIRNFYLKTGKKVGFKPAGGLKTSEDTLQWLKLIVTELGVEWLSLFRIGASSLLDNIEKSLAAY